MKPHLTFPPRRLVLLLVLACAAAFGSAAEVVAQDPSQFDAAKPEDLFKASWDTADTTEKIIIRSYLAKKYPGTAIGLFSRAYIADYDGRAEEAIKLYRESLSVDPEFLPVMTNLAILLSGKEKIEAHEKILAKDPSFRDYDSIKVIYQEYVNVLKDKQSADAFLLKWRQRLPGVFIFDLIQAEHARFNENNYALAEKYYLEAIAKGTDDFDVYSQLTDLRLTHLSDADTPREQRLAYLELIKNYALRHPRSERPYLYLGLQMREVFRDHAEAIRYYQKAFETRPTAEAVAGVYNTAGDECFCKVRDRYDFFVEADRKLPHNQRILSFLSAATDDRQKKEAYLNDAIKFSYTLKDEAENAAALAGTIYEDTYADYDKAQSIYLQYLDKGANKNWLLRKLHNNRLEAQDFKAALKYLGEQEAFLRAGKGVNERYFRHARRTLDGYLKAEERAASFYRENPFLGHWQAQFGESLKLSINFGVNSERIPAGDAPKLARVARLLQEQGADKYIFSIEGHADGGEERLNSELSLKRALAVVRELNEVHGVPLNRMRAAGYKSDAPLVPNTTDEGRRQNRRVEVLPFGSLDQPALLATAAMNAAGIGAVSPDGGVIAVGYEPIQLWDARQKIKLKDLRGGGLRKFSPNGRYLAFSSRNREDDGTVTDALFVYDVKTGLAVMQLPSPYRIFAFDWDPYSQKIVYLADKNLVIYDLKAKRRERRAVVEGNQLPVEVLWTRDGKYIVTKQNDPNELKVWDAAALSYVRSLPGVGPLYALGQTSDSKYILGSEEKGDLNVWTAGTWALRRERLLGPARTIAPMPGQQVVAVGTHEGRESKTLLYDVERNSVIGTRPVPQPFTLGASPDGAKLYAVLGDKVKVLDASKPALDEVSEITGTAPKPLSGWSDEKNNYYISADGAGIHVWDIRTGKKAHFWNKKADGFRQVRGVSDQFFSLVLDDEAKQTRVALYDTSKLTQQDVLTLPYRVQYCIATADFIAVAGIEFVPFNTGAETGLVEVYDRGSLKLRSKKTVPMLTEYLVSNKLGASAFTAFDISPDGREALVATQWYDGGNLMTTKEARLYPLASEEKFIPFKLTRDVLDVEFDRDNPDQVRVYSDGGASTYNKKGEYVGWDTTQNGYETRVRLSDKNAVMLWTSLGIEYRDPAKGIDKFVRLGGNLVSVDVYEKQNLLVLLTSENEVSFHDLTSFEKMLSIIPKNNNEWIAYAPSGEFVSSANGSDRVYWSLGDQYLEFSALQSKFERPAIIADRLNSIFRRTEVATTLPGNAAAVVGYFTSYKLEILTQRIVETSDSRFTVKVRVEKTRAGLPDPVLLFVQNQQELENGDGGAAAQPVVQRELELREGANLIEVSVKVDNVLVGTKSIVITKVPAAEAATARSKLWFLGVGVATYDKPENRLEYPVKDIEVIADALRRQEGVLYEKVEVKLLRNDEVREANVIDTMVNFLGQASSQDTLVIFVSGHGVLDTDGGLYLLPYDGDTSKPHLAIDVTRFSNFLRKRPASQKKIFWIDMCYAGAYDPGVKRQSGTQMIDEAVRDLARGAGFIVLAASTAKQPAREDPSFGGGHSAFALSIIEALTDKAEPSVCNQSQRLSVTVLTSYVLARVPKITGGKQTPTIPEVTNLQDYPIAMCRPPN